MRLGYLAVDEQTGDKIALTKPDVSPRKQLLEHFSVNKCRKMFVDKTDGSSAHIGYIVSRRWFRILEVHSWERRGP
jgi:hypothetical protein